MLTERQENLLAAVLKEYIRTAEPVGSSTLAKRYGFDISPATIRIELSVLEDMNLIEQPHTSAGRIPCESGYLYYVQQILSKKKKSKKSIPSLKSVSLPEDPEQAVKTIAKQVAEGSKLAVLVGFRPRQVYYTGLSQLFSQPEFREYARIARFSEVIDRLDEVIEQVFDSISDDMQIWLGKENPFGQMCSTVITRYGKGEHSGVIGILGPMRMDYERNSTLLEFAQNILNERV